MPPPILALVHYIHPALLSLPLPFLFAPKAAPPPALPGITPVTVQVTSPRRGLVLTALALLAFTSFLDISVLVGDILSARARYGEELPARLVGTELWAGVVYGVGELLVWGIALVATVWRERFGKGLLVLGVLGVVGEIVNLVFLVKRELHASGSEHLFSILSLVPSSARLLLLPVLLSAVAAPRVSFEPATERTGLLSESSEGTLSHSRETTAASDYGTFVPGTGVATPAPGPAQTDEQIAEQQRLQQEERNKQRKIKINKQLGSKRQPKKMLSLKEAWPKFKKILPMLWPSTSPKLQFYVGLTGLFILLERGLNPLLPITLGWVIAALGNWSSPVDVWKALGAYLFIRFIDSYGVISALQQYFWIPVVQYTDREMQLMSFNHLIDLSLSYHTKRNTGEVMRIVDRGSAINEVFRTCLFSVIPTIADTVIGLAVFLWLFGPLITFSIIGVMVPYCVFSFIATRITQKTRREYIDNDVRQRGIVSDVLTNWESVKYFTSESREAARFEEAVDDLLKVDYKWRMGYQVIYAIQSLILVVAFAVGAVLLALRIMNGNGSSASFVVYVTYFSQFTRPLNQLSSLYKEISSDITDAEKLLALLGEQTDIKDKPDAKELILTDGVIEFDNVTFSYDGKKDAIKNISFKLEKGQSLALVGQTGSGKSTILRLLYRFYDIQSGHIYIDGQDISSVTQASLRRAIGIVPQDSVLWNDSIAANIAYGDPNATDEEVIEAAKAGRIHDKIMSFDEQYDTLVGERGVRLSGGEKQRVSLSRMFLKNPRILVLDEATSALDTETEREIQKSLTKLAEGRTSLSIAHRLSTIINSDKIVVMGDGEIVEIGTYQELIDKDGTFATMWRRQIYTEAELLEGDAIDQFARALPTAADFRHYRETGEAVKSPTAEKKQEGSHAGDGNAPQLEAAVPAAKEDVPEVDAKNDAEGFEVEQSAPAPGPIAEDPKALSFADTVKADAEPKTEEVEAEVGQASREPASEETKEVAPKTEEAPEPEVKAPETFADKAAAPVAPSGTVPEPATPKVVPFPSAASPRPVSFPGPPSLSTPANHRLSTLSAYSASPTTPGNEPPSPTKSDAVSGFSDKSGTPGSGTEDKRRKRLSSIKGFVRRISDQGGLTRSASGLKSPRVSTDGGLPETAENEADERTTLLSPSTAEARSPAPEPAAKPQAPIKTHGGGSSRKEKKKNKRSRH
ncbi:hypothetical protein L202_02867 [Cryptococcus amylolentus CBS 6039]|uniref:ABC transporter n=2 Tax=Cryptococcus amylolentus TaxID=104669 RepID=A0A1E3HYR0_9TREE|nr:hypothetical protein L202_02867 [Cryptococcus amylolentus CBS 6039]ODN80701.1 hypothetical protein L202_02867 [Cryptococcus amylolentus CBS 6039]ODO09243.1 hypothetical protein I350_02843 [Cryptococcus amylolentus CBS 6273]